jgi:Tfp pilus assembly PilM family ATPase
MNYYLGIELNGNQLKISAFKKRRSMFELVKLDTFNLAKETDEVIKELTSWIVHNLSDQTSVRAVLTISESILYIKVLEFPKMDSAKLNEAIYWEIPSVAPISQSDAVFDWQIISEDKGKLNVLVIVGKYNFIQDIINTFRSAQIDIAVVEPSSYAFARIVNAPLSNNTLLCIAEQLGMDFIILKNGIPVFTTSTTGDTQSQKILHIKSGIDLTNELGTEGKKIINYWESRESQKIHQVVIGGDLVYKYVGLNSSLNFFLPLPCHIGTPRNNKFFKTGKYTDLELGSYMVSLGAALRHLSKDILEGINLTPPEEKQKTEILGAQKKLINLMLAYVYTNIVIIIFLVSTFLSLYVWRYSLEKQQINLSNSVSVQSKIKLIDDIKNTNSKIEDVVTLLKLQNDFGTRLKDISNLTPETIKITSIDLANDESQEWTIKGTGDRGSILAYYEKISQDAKVSEISMPYSNFNKNSSDNVFSILIKW